MKFSQPALAPGGERALATTAGLADYVGKSRCFCESGT
jgi:hypothetical protein